VRVCEPGTCGQRHVVSRRRRMNTDWLLCVRAGVAAAQRKGRGAGV